VLEEELGVHSPGQRRQPPVLRRAADAENDVQDNLPLGLLKGWVLGD
jgi:hypothetical protein